MFVRVKHVSNPHKDVRDPKHVYLQFLRPSCNPHAPTAPTKVRGRSSDGQGVRALTGGRTVGTHETGDVLRRVSIRRGGWGDGGERAEP